MPLPTFLWGRGGTRGVEVGEYLRGDIGSKQCGIIFFFIKILLCDKNLQLDLILRRLVRNTCIFRNNLISGHFDLYLVKVGSHSNSG